MDVNAVLDGSLGGVDAVLIKVRGVFFMFVNLRRTFGVWDLMVRVNVARMRSRINVIKSAVK